MKFSEVTTGRVFVIRLEDGEIIHDQIEHFARHHQVKCASIIALGGIDKGSILIAGPEDGRSVKIIPAEIMLDNVFEITGTGTIFPDKNNNPLVHMHISCGRNDKTYTGCIQRGVKVWQVLEIILTEITNCTSQRIADSITGFKLLHP